VLGGQGGPSLTCATSSTSGSGSGSGAAPLPPPLRDSSDDDDDDDDDGGGDDDDDDGGGSCSDAASAPLLPTASTSPPSLPSLMSLAFRLQLALVYRCCSRASASLMRTLICAVTHRLLSTTDNHRHSDHARRTSIGTAARHTAAFDQ
jgi:hypothetical protein